MQYAQLCIYDIGAICIYAIKCELVSVTKISVNLFVL